MSNECLQAGRHRPRARTRTTVVVRSTTTPLLNLDLPS